MPLKRTPPKPTTETKASNSPHTIPKAGSTPNLSIPDADNNTNRKRKRSDDSLEELRELIKSHTAQTDIKFKALQESLSEIIAQNVEIKENINFISKQYDDMVIRTEKLEAERKSDRSYINQLEDKLENMERMLNLSKMEIRNIPKTKDESKEDLCKIVTETASALDVPLQRQDIKDIFRVNKKEGVFTIIVDFVNTATKENIVQKVRKFNKNNAGNKLNSSHIKIEGPPKPIYLSECLTQKAQHLYYMARNFARDYSYKFCWTSFGKVFVRRIEGEKQILIKHEADLINLRQNK